MACAGRSCVHATARRWGATVPVPASIRRVCFPERRGRVTFLSELTYSKSGCLTVLSTACQYEGVARDTIIAALNGFNACLLCYGQTGGQPTRLLGCICFVCAYCYMRPSGSGKTHTVFGPPGALQASQRCGSCSIPDTHDRPLSLTHIASGMNLWDLPSRLGIVPRACAELLSATACNGVATSNIRACRVFNRTHKLCGPCCHRRSRQHEDLRAIYW